MSKIATIYFDTGGLNYKYLYWQHAVSYSALALKDLQDSPVLTRGSGPWFMILPYLGERAINMRKVCTFFLQPCFEAIYKASPITPEGTDYRNIVLSMISRSNTLTNHELYFRKDPSPIFAGLMQTQSLTATHWKNIENKMPQCRSIGPICAEEVMSVLQKGKIPGVLVKLRNYL